MPEHTVVHDRDTSPASWQTHFTDAVLAVVGGASIAAAYAVDADWLAYALAAIGAACGLALVIRHREETSR